MDVTCLNCSSRIPSKECIIKIYIMKIQVIAKEPTSTSTFVTRTINMIIYTNSANLQSYIGDQLLAQMNVYAQWASFQVYRGFEYPWVTQGKDYDYCVTFLYRRNPMSVLQYNDLRNRLRTTVRELRRRYKAGLLTDRKGQ